MNAQPSCVICGVHENLRFIRNYAGVEGANCYACRNSALCAGRMTTSPGANVPPPPPPGKR